MIRYALSGMLTLSNSHSLRAASLADTADDAVSDRASTDEDYPRGASSSSLRVPQNSESSAGSSEGAVELEEILDSAQRSDDNPV